MLNFAANLSWLYTELPFLDRFEAAARDGFTGVECLFPHEHPTAEIQARLQGLGLQLVLFNAAPGDWAAGERGLASLEGRDAEFQRSIDAALALATALNCPRVHVMAGLLPLGNTGDTADANQHQAARSRFEQRLAWAATQAQAAGLTLLIEPINTRDMPGYLLSDQASAHGLVERIGSPHLKVQMDLYHCQIMEGDITTRLRRWLPAGQVGHLQIAAVPDRGEPNQGELNYPHLFSELQALGWQDWIGCEYKPRQAGAGGTSAGLGWLRAQR
ncbi:MAG: 2-oxo-tetronate isomerase [Aquabacterium sp.]|jgi:hydroxypyruvate isomerase|uniref:2-oxo-tetronate isomerase n=1 Tax=Aquabacterium sp. TaxID=1872578 RepID=UPI003BB20E54